MAKIKISILIIFFLVPVWLSAQKISRSEYINLYKHTAIQEMDRTGIPASITMAQAILESESGNSRLAQKANNHFGIKCHNDWNGATIRHDDDRRNECFRKYNSPEESFQDHSKFLQKGKRYRFLFNYEPTDYKKWARGLKKAGYATNPQYANKLIELIDRHDLHQLDLKNSRVAKNKNMSEDNNPTAEQFSISSGDHQVQEKNRVSYVVARKGDTYASLTDEFDKMRWELRKYNDVPDGVEPEPGQIVYLQPKRNRAALGKKHYTIKEGETMWYVSQKFAVKLSKLYKKNRMEPGSEPETSQKIWLRRKKPRN